MTEIIIECAQPWFDFIKNGIKKIEGRKQSLKFKHIVKDDILRFKCSSNLEQQFLVKVIKVNFYSSLTEYLINEGIENCLPGITELDEAQHIYLQYSTLEEIKNCGGMMAIHIEII
jgi:ASC-1-like (ASCH) protein